MKKTLLSYLFLFILCLSFSHAEETHELQLPLSSSVIQAEAFMNSDGFDRVLLPEGITKIQDHAFANCSITAINLPKSLSYIANDAFDGCSDIEFTVYEHSYAQKWCTANNFTPIILPDPSYPETIAFSEPVPSFLEVGSTFVPMIEVSPETAVPELVWSSSNPEIVSVDPVNGKIGARASGSATIEAVSNRNPVLTLRYKISVLAPERCLVMPQRRTSIDKISATLNQIESVRSSAYRELEVLYSLGDISKSEYDTRKSIVSRAFDMYLFPWMTAEEEPYWNAANSEEGAKDFKTDTVYYGLPYTQLNRRYNAASALSKGYFYDSGKNYYLLDNSKFTDGMYPGCDESSFASMAVWGAGTSHSYDSTRDIAETSVYTTVTDWSDLRPGDLINDYNHHVVIFLYWANEAHTQMVIIEQGGGEDGINTISCSLHDASYYMQSKWNYKIRRLTSLM